MDDLDSPRDQASAPGVRTSRDRGGMAAAANSGVEVLSWGSNYEDELGEGPNGDRHMPGPVVLPEHTTVTSVAAGDSHGLAVTLDGRVLAWGYNNHGQLGDGSTYTRDHAVQAGLPAGVRAAAVAAGQWFSLALTSVGQVFAWGNNDYYGELGIGDNFDEKHTPVHVPIPWSKLGLPSDTTVTAISASYAHSLALTSTGHVLAWGDNAHGQLGDGSTSPSNTPVKVKDLPPPGTTVTAIAAGFMSSLALTSDGQVHAWGMNDDGELGNGNNQDSHTPVRVCLPAGATVTAIGAGGGSSLAVTSFGKVLAWGTNITGQLGNGSPWDDDHDSNTPVYVLLPASTRVVAVACGYGHNLAVTSYGKMLAWGRNTSGALGNGTTNPPVQTTPVRVLLPSGVRATDISAGTQFSLAVVH